MIDFVAIKKIYILDVGEFGKGTKWEGRENRKGEWKLRIKGTNRYFYFTDKSIKSNFKKV